MGWKSDKEQKVYAQNIFEKGFCMILIFEGWQIRWHDSEVLTSCKGFKTYDIDLKQFGYNIQNF